MSRGWRYALMAFSAVAAVFFLVPTLWAADNDGLTWVAGAVGLMNLATLAWNMGRIAK